MTDEFYHRDIFGSIVDIDLGQEESEDKPLPNKGGRAFNIFAFTDAIGARKKREAWILCRKALASGLSSEEVFFKLVWQIKTMLIAGKTKNAQEAGMNAFPYSKAKGFLKNFKEGELEKLSEALVVGYHEARRRNEEIETFVEKILLGL